MTSLIQHEVHNTHRRCIRGFQKSIFNKHGEKWNKTTTAVCIFSLLQYYIEMACDASSVGSPLSMGAADRDVTELPSSVVYVYWRNILHFVSVMNGLNEGATTVL